MTKDRGYTDEDMREVADNPEWTDEELATAKPLEHFLPELAASLARTRARRSPPRAKVTLDLDKAVVDHFRSTGKGWESRMGDVLRKAAGL